MGFGIDVVFIIILGLVVLGPKQLHTLLGHVARAKAQFEEVRRSLKTQLAAELDATHREGDADASHELVGD